MSQATKSPPDPLKEKMDSIAKRVQDTAYETKKAYDQSTVGRAQKEWTGIAKFWYQLCAAFGWIYHKIIFPITSRLLLFIRWVFRGYRALWSKVVYRNDQYGEARFSKSRGGIMVLATFFGVSILWIWLQIAAVGVFWYWPTVKHNEQIYLFSSQKISNGLNPYSDIDDVYEVHGCETLPCSSNDSITFHVSGSWFNEAWAMLHKGELFYPNYVAAIAPGWQRCTVVSYGWRKKFRSLARQLDFYPSLLDMKECFPVNKDDPVLNNKDYRG